MKTRYSFPLLISITLAAFLPGRLGAHCDTMAGPVITEAKAAFQKGDVTPLLKWVKKGDEAAVKKAFEKAYAARKNGAKAKEAAERGFFETLVKIHREGEGAPYTGLKEGTVGHDSPEGLADETLEKGALGGLDARLAKEVEKGIQKRFEKVTALRKNKDKSVEDGRAWVAAYVDYLHYVTGLHAAITGPVGHHHDAEETAHESHHGK